MTHQGMTYFNATSWVGANALVRRSALEEIAIETIERGHKIKIYIQDRTMIEDTAATIDLVSRDWGLHSYPARLAFSATPPDFGSLLIQRRRWSNGGLLILPALARYMLQRPFGRFREGALRSHYMLGQAIESVAILVLTLSSVDDKLFSIWMPLVAVSYQIVYALDLVIAGYKYSDLPRVYALNLLLVPVRIGGTVQSLKQACTGRKQAFGRTPKVAERTATPILYLAAIYGLAVWCAYIVIKDMSMGRAAHAVFAFLNSAALLYGLWRYIGFRAALEDFWAHARSRGQIVWNKCVVLGPPLGAFVGLQRQRRSALIPRPVPIEPQSGERSGERFFGSIVAGDADRETRLSIAERLSALPPDFSAVESLAQALDGG